MNIFNSSLFKNISKTKFVIWITILITSTLFLSCDSNDKSKSSRPLVYLNHVFITVDRSTYSDICNSDFIKNTFASIETETIKPDSNASWTGTYITGQNTYIEIFKSGDEVNGNEINQGNSGLAFGTENSGDIDSIYKSISDTQRKHIQKDLRHFRTETRDIPWFNYLYSTKRDSSSILSTWVMEYLPEYAKYKFPKIEPEAINITRQLFNHKSYKKDLLLKDIAEVEIALNEYDRIKLKEAMELYGYDVERLGNKLVGKGPNINIIIRDKNEDKTGICNIKFILNGNQHNKQIINFGTKSKLILNTDNTAVWQFSI